MQRLVSPRGVTVSYDLYGGGPPLVLVHGAFSDHHTNWEFVKPLLEPHFTVHAVARRGRGQTDATRDHRLEDESHDVAALLESLEEPVFLLGHSYGAQVALGAARQVPEQVQKLVLYEPPWPNLLNEEVLAPLEALAERGDWDGFAVAFFRDLLSVLDEDLDVLRGSELWPPIVADAPASLGDLRALARYRFEPERFGHVSCPVLLQIGSDSPRDLYVTDALAAVLPDCRVEVLDGQAHEGMTTAPELYTAAVVRFLSAQGSHRDAR